MNNNVGIITMAKELIMKVGRIGKNRLACHDLCVRCYVMFRTLTRFTNTFYHVSEFERETREFLT